MTPVPLGEYTLTSWLGMMVSSLSMINCVGALPLAMNFCFHALQIGVQMMVPLVAVPHLSMLSIEMNSGYC